MGTVTPPELGLTTAADREITDRMRDKVAQHPVDQARRATGAKPTLQPEEPLRGIQYKLLAERSPEYLGDYWRQCRALYAGGPRLLKDEQVLKSLFPSHANEAPDVYKERCERAFYIAYPGEIIDHLLAGFAQDPIRLDAGKDEESQEPKPLPPWWSDFAADVSPPGGAKQSLSAFAVECLREMFVTQSAWVLIDLPPRDPTAAPPASKLEEEQAGLLDPYLCLMPSDNVVDWQVDEDTGELEWVMCYWRTRRRMGIRASRNVISERWLYWTREGWERYETAWEPTQPPKADDIVPLVAEGKHSFGVVPMVRIQVPEGLYAMGKLESIAREHFNKRCAASWAEYKALFAVLYEFMAQPGQGAFTPKMGPASDPNRAVNQIRGMGYSQLRSEKDRAEYVGPDVAPFKEARESCAELMREMHRVTFSMALSANMDSAALQRSGESKAKDAVQIATILAKVGELMRDGLEIVFDLVARVRKEERNVSASGGEKFNADDIAAAITEAVELLNGIPMKSPTFMKRYLYRIYKLGMGPNATAKDLEDIREELETMVTAEALLAADASPPGPGGEEGDDGDREDDDDQDDEPEKPTPAPTPRGRRIYPVP